MTTIISYIALLATFLVSTLLIYVGLLKAELI